MWQHGSFYALTVRSNLSLQTLELALQIVYSQLPLVTGEEIVLDWTRYVELSDEVWPQERETRGEKCVVNW